MTDRFHDYRDSMTAALQRYLQYATTAELIETSTLRRLEQERADHPQATAGELAPIAYQLGQALEANLDHRLARARRDSARRTAVMWATAAQVEAAFRR